MKGKLIFLLVAIGAGSIFSQAQTGFRGGLNLSSNMESGQGPVLGWHLAGYMDIETEWSNYRMEFKCQKIGYQKNDTTLVSIWYASFPLLFDVNKYKGNVEFFIGVEPGVFIVGNDIPKKRMRSLKYIPKLNHKESAKKPIALRQDFNIEGVFGFKIRSKPDVYFFVNEGFLTGDLYFSVSIGF